MDTPQKTTSKETGISRGKLVDWYNFCRDESSRERTSSPAAGSPTQTSTHWPMASIRTRVVIHEVFIEDDMVHTRNIENTWMRAKRKLKRQFGTSRDLFHTYLDEFMWRCSVDNKNYFGQVLANITESYSFQ